MDEKYVVKLGSLYADGMRGWTSDYSKAFVFRDDAWGSACGFFGSKRTAGKWAYDHMVSLRSEYPDGVMSVELYTEPAVKLTTTA
jgi:hypothetical protein